MFKRFRFDATKRATNEPIDLLDSVGSFQLYYGHLNPDYLAVLSKYDLVILESQHLVREHVTYLQQARTLVFGYISFMETPLWHTNRLPHLSKTDILVLNQRPMFLTKWNAYLMDLRQPSYQRTLLAEIDQLIQEKQINGILIDTVGDIDDFVLDPMLADELREAYTTLLAMIRKRHPSLLLMQNRGFGTLEAAVPLLNGFLWEDWKAPARTDTWTQEQINRMRTYQKQGFHLFAVSSDPNPIHESSARKLGFLHLTHRGDYHLFE